ncbi:MAG TPA: metallophosphoesterase [Phycisphaerae bacterium]|nr:metallophosphoesterase [Phycisphaerae bacterium]
MADRETSRRSFIVGAGAAAICGICGLPHIACREADGAGAEAPVRAKGKLLKLLGVGEGVFRPTADGATIHWIPNGEVESELLTGTSGNDLKIVRSVVSSVPVELQIDGLSGAAEVFWSARHRRKGEQKWVNSPVRSFKTCRQKGESFQAALFADSHFYSVRNRAQSLGNIQKCMNAVQKARPDFCVFLGDEAGVQYVTDEKTQDQALARERWLNWREYIGPLLSEVPSFLVLGNHEGEAGFYRDQDRARKVFLQRWGTIERKRHYLNPLPSTYAEGGENQNWKGNQKSGATGGADEGNCSPFQNYFAWTWGDALFVVLDVHRYTNPGKSTPAVPEEWTLGRTQLKWLEQVLKNSDARWKFVIAHHVVGGSRWDLNCKVEKSGYAYGRGGARYARVGEQAKVTDLMKRYGSRFFVYGHDHIFAHQEAEGIHFVCCGRPTKVPGGWVQEEGFIEAYGDFRARDPHDFYLDVGYTKLTVSPSEVVFEYIKTGMDPEGNENTAAKVGDVVHRVVVT